MACEQNILEVPVSPSLPALTDLILFTLPDGTSILRTWAQCLQVLPTDVEVVVAASGGEINNGDETFTVAEQAGLRVRMIRNGIVQGRTPNATGYYYDFDITTGTYTFVPVAATEDFFQFTTY
jgi:hypothetical protein